MSGPLTRIWSQARGETYLATPDPYDLLRRGGQTALAAGSFYGDSGLDTSRVDYAMARLLYRNKLPTHKLGAHFAKPAVNYLAGYMSVPKLKHDGQVDAANAWLADQMRRWLPRILLVNRNSLREGDVYVRLDHQPSRFRRESKRLVMKTLPPEWCTPQVNPITGEWDALLVTFPVLIKDRSGRGWDQQYLVTEILTPTTYERFADPMAPADVQALYRVPVQANPWGFIPVVAFRNEPEDGAVYGTSDLEPLEPLLRAYHQVMVAGADGIQMFAKPKAKIRVKDAAAFMLNNFPGWRPGEPLNFRGRDLFVLQTGDQTSGQEDIEFVTAAPGTDGVQMMLEVLFYCHDAQTEVLTERGWMRFRDVPDGVRVATRSPAGVLEWQAPEVRLEQPYSGPMHVNQSARLDYCVTPGHRMLLRDGRLVPVESLPVRAYYPRCAGGPDGDGEPWAPPAVEDRPWLDGRSSRRVRHGPLAPAPREAVGRFLGIWLAEGSVHSAWGDVLIRQTKPQGIAWIDQVFRDLGWPHRRVQYGKQVHWEIRDPALATWIAQAAGDGERTVPVECFGWSKAARAGILEGMAVGDGAYEKRNGRLAFLCSTSKRLADDMQALMHLDGQSARVKLGRPAGVVTGTLSGKTVRATKPLYYVVPNRDPAVEDRATARTVVLYSGMVYCMEVPNHTLLTRRNGVPLWSGNCVVQTSQTPEAIYGAAVPSSKASVDSQMGPFTKTVERKRALAQDPYQELGQMALAMGALVGEVPSLLTYETRAEWDEVTPKDEQSMATVFMNLVNGLVSGLDAKLFSPEAASDFLRPFMPTMLPYLGEKGKGKGGERERILEQLAFIEQQTGGQVDPNADPTADPQADPNAPPNQVGQPQRAPVRPLARVS